MNPNDFSDILTFPVVPPSGQNFSLFLQSIMTLYLQRLPHATSAVLFVCLQILACLHTKLPKYTPTELLACLQTLESSLITLSDKISTAHVVSDLFSTDYDLFMAHTGFL